MSVMRAPEAWSDDRVFTVEDLEDMPDDEFRYELDDGVLIVSPAPSNWIIEPGPEKPGLTVFELHRGRYAQTAHVAGADSLDVVRPFPVTIVPADLVATGSG